MSLNSIREVNFDGLVGLTHNYSGLAHGNVASMSHGGLVSNQLRVVVLRLVRGPIQYWGTSTSTPQQLSGIRACRRWWRRSNDTSCIS